MSKCCCSRPTALTTSKPVDVAFTSQNYHDYPDKFMGPTDPAMLDKAVFAALKPGGTYIVIDHVAEAGSGLRDTDTLHRIDPAFVKQQVEAAGFEYVGESDVLRNPNDDHKAKVFDSVDPRLHRPVRRTSSASRRATARRIEPVAHIDHGNPVLSPIDRRTYRHEVDAVRRHRRQPRRGRRRFRPARAHGVPAYVVKAVADPARGDDAKNDARRKVAELVAFSGVKPGDSVLELIPGSGYFTRSSARSSGRRATCTRCGPSPTTTSRIRTRT